MRKYCVITLRSVFVQGIRALHTLSPYIYYELLVLIIPTEAEVGEAALKLGATMG